MMDLDYEPDQPTSCGFVGSLNETTPDEDAERMIEVSDRKIIWWQAWRGLRDAVEDGMREPWEREEYRQVCEKVGEALDRVMGGPLTSGEMK